VRTKSRKTIKGDKKPECRQALMKGMRPMVNGNKMAILSMGLSTGPGRSANLLSFC
jgi:hypothetical protein